MVITAKAKVVAEKAGLSPQFDITTIIGIITQIFSALAACKPTAPAVHQAISRPGILQHRAMKRVIRENIKNAALRPHIESAVLQVGASSTQDETSQMYEEATGEKPS